MAYYVGIDLGGTNIKAGVVDEKGELLNKLSIKTHAERSMEEIIYDMGKLAVDVIKDCGKEISDIEAIGIGSPGTPDNEEGLLVYSANLPFNMAPMRKLIRDVIDLPVYIDNDANCAAMAEAVAGAAKGTKDSVTITLGTGVGAGVIINGRIYSGFNQAGSEFGHTVLVSGGIQCKCGRRGCFEQYASASALARMAQEAADSNPDSILKDLIAKEGGPNAKLAFDAMKAGDKVAAELVDRYTDYLADGLANVINTFMPEVLVVGGGVCNEGDPLLIPMREKTMSRPYFGPGVKKTEIRLAEMGNDAGIVGAAMMGKACLDDGKNGR
ncbi:MAG: ROK family protein [Clostridiales bacterium]|jgi:glucokinase|nr:ROK family protein [Clostridiales bacterium]